MRCDAWVSEGDSLGRKRVGRQCGSNATHQIVERDSTATLRLCDQHSHDFKDNSDYYTKEPIV